MAIRMSSPASAAISRNGLRAGASVLFEGFALLRRERSLWALAAAPVFLATVAVGCASWLVFAHSAEINAWIGAWLPAVAASSWYSWLWVGPLIVALGVAHAVLFLFVSAAAVLAAFLGATLLAAPLLELLSQRVERVAGGSCTESNRGLLGDAFAALSNELRRVTFFASVSAGLGLLSLVPGVQVVTPFAFALFSMLFLPLEYCGAALDRRSVSFADRRRWIRSHGRTMLGFGAMGLATFAVPGLNFVMIPVLVAGGTLLVVRLEPSGPTPQGPRGFEPARDGSALGPREASGTPPPSSDPPFAAQVAPFAGVTTPIR